jgi:hypothetical protein
LSATLAHERPYSKGSLAAPVPQLAISVLITLCTCKLLLHLFTSVRHYGYFRDELYYLDLARQRAPCRARIGWRRSLLLRRKKALEAEGDSSAPSISQ